MVAKDHGGGTSRATRKNHRSLPRPTNLPFLTTTIRRAVGRCSVGSTCGVTGPAHRGHHRLGLLRYLRERRAEPGRRVREVERNGLRRRREKKDTGGEDSATCEAARQDTAARQQEKNRKSAVAAYLLWWLVFLGIAGIHRFYVGKWISGLLWLITGGLFLFGQAIDVILIPGMIRETNLRTQLAARR